MKKVLASLLAAYALNTNYGQAPPPGQVPGTPVTTASATSTTAIRLATSTTSAATSPATTAAATTSAAPIETTTSPPVQTGTLPATTASATAAPPATTLAATTSAPGTTASATTAAPVQTTSAPVQTTSAPVETTSAPIQTTAAPVTTQSATTATPVQTTSAPIQTTSAPVQTTSAPVQTTEAPAPTVPPSPPVNLLCPPGSGIGRPTGFGSADQACIMPGQRAQDFMGNVRCDAYSCCFCEHITCGYQGFPCESMQFGDYGGIGVQSIWLDGRFAINTNGATLECDGVQGCKGSKIIGNDIWKASCGAREGCDGAEIALYNPRPEMEFAANGQFSLRNAKLDIIVGEPGTVCTGTQSTGLAMVSINSIVLNGDRAGENAVITVANYGCTPLRIGNLECHGLTSCPGTDFKLEGNIIVDRCVLPGLANTASLPPALRSCAMGPLGPLTPGFVPPANPAVPAQPAQPAVPVTPTTPVIPVTPTTPVTPAQPVTPVTPSVPAPPAQPVTPGIPVSPQQPLPNANIPGQLPTPILAPGYSAKLNCDSRYTICSGQTLTIPIQNNFVLECALPGTCSNSHIILEAGIDPHTFLPVERIDSIKSIGISAASNSIVEIIDTRPQYPGMAMLPIRINDLRCENPCTCEGLSIIAGPGIDIWSMNVDCSEPQYCAGCTITSGGITRPCDMMAPMLPPGITSLCAPQFGGGLNIPQTMPVGFI